MSEYNRKNLIADLSKVWPNAEWKGVTKAEILWLCDFAIAMMSGGPRDMSSTLRKYRVRYQATTAYSGRASLNNGDAIAEFLEGMEPIDVMKAAEQILGLENGELVARYENLNPGQQRMNAGNRLRAALKRGDIKPEDLVH